MAEGRQVYGRGVSASGVMHPSSRHRRLVSSRLVTHTRMYACTCTYLREASCGSRVLNEPSPSPLPSPVRNRCGVSGRSTVARCLASSARHFLSSHPPPPCGALLFTLLVPVHGMWIRPSYPHTSFPSSQSICEQGSSFVPHVCTRMHLMRHGHIGTLSNRSEGPTV